MEDKLKYCPNCDDMVVAKQIYAGISDDLATKVAISNLHKTTIKSISEIAQVFHALLPPYVYKIIIQNADRLDSEIRHDRDFDYVNYNVFQIFKLTSLLRVGKKYLERPQLMLMRMAVGIHKYDIDSVVQTYHLMSQGFFTHASIFRVNADAQVNSCLLVCVKDDNGEPVSDTIKPAGGIGISIHKNHNRRAVNSSKEPSVLTSTRIAPPILKLLYSNEHFADRREESKGTPAVYLEPWHADVYDFLDLANKHGQDRFYALWVPDLFMERVKSDSQWSLFRPDDAPGLSNCQGEEFDNLYTEYEREGRETKVVRAQRLMSQILESAVKSGALCILFKDNCHRNAACKQMFDILKLPKPCTEIVECVCATQTVAGNLASIALPKFVKEKGVPSELQPCKLVGSYGSENRYFDFDKLAEVTRVVANNLNKIIDVNSYPVEVACSNLRHRPIGISVHGLADTFILLGMPFDSPEARQLNKDIFETIYYHALKMSCTLAERDDPYDTYEGSALSKGILEPDMWGVVPSNRWDWDGLREMIGRNGVRNTVVLAPVSSSLTSQILDCNASVEPYASYINMHTVVSGEYVVNKHLSHDLDQMGLCSSTLNKRIIQHNGSVQRIPEIASSLKAIYRTAYEIKPKTLVDMALDRGCFIGETQTINLKANGLNPERLLSLYLYTWGKGRC